MDEKLMEREKWANESERGEREERSVSIEQGRRGEKKAQDRAANIVCKRHFNECSSSQTWYTSPSRSTLSTHSSRWFFLLCYHFYTILSIFPLKVHFRRTWNEKFVCFHFHHFPPSEICCVSEWDWKWFFFQIVDDILMVLVFFTLHFAILCWDWI